MVTSLLEDHERGLESTPQNGSKYLAHTKGQQLLPLRLIRQLPLIEAGVAVCILLVVNPVIKAGLVSAHLLSLGTHTP